MAAMARPLVQPGPPGGGFIGPTLPDPFIPCDCYWPEDCGDDISVVTCTSLDGDNIPGGDPFCGNTGKYDGLCVSIPTPGGGSDPGRVGPGPEYATSLGGFLLAYSAAASAFVDSEETIGRPDPGDWAAAAEVSQDSLEAAMVANGIMDGVLGFDFVPPADFQRQGGVGNLRSVPDLDAARLFIATASKVAQDAVVDGHVDTLALQVAWDQHPDFSPAHAGRCYEHGHADHAPKPPDCWGGIILGQLALHTPGGTESGTKWHLAGEGPPSCEKCFPADGGAND